MRGTEKNSMVVNEKELKQQKQRYDRAAGETVARYSFYLKAQKKADKEEEDRGFPDIHTIYELESRRGRYQRAYERWYKEAETYAAFDNVKTMFSKHSIIRDMFWEQRMYG